MTMQIPDKLEWQGIEHKIISGDLVLQKLFPEIVIPKFELKCSACWCGYIETWLIDDSGWLRISRIDYFSETQEYMEPPNQLYNLIPNYDNPIAALGFTGDVTVGFGEDVKSHGLYSYSYPKYIVFSFEHGKLKHFEEHDRAWWIKDNEAYELPDFLKIIKGY